MKRTLLTVAALVLVAGCGGEAETSSKKKADTKASDLPVRELPDDWASTIDNPWLPLAEGASWTYEKKTADGTEDVVVTVTDQKKTVDGVKTTRVPRCSPRHSTGLCRLGLWFRKPGYR